MPSGTMEPTIGQSSAVLKEIIRKVEKGDRLDREDGLALERHADINLLGELANLARERKNGNIGWFNVNVHLNPTNV